MRLQALKCKCCFPHVIKEELTSTYIIQGAEYQFYLRWDKKLAARKKKSIPKSVNLWSLSSMVWSFLTGQGDVHGSAAECSHCSLDSLTQKWTEQRCHLVALKQTASSVLALCLSISAPEREARKVLGPISFFASKGFAQGSSSFGRCLLGLAKQAAAS